MFYNFCHHYDARKLLSEVKDQQEFKAIKNMVIREAEELRLGVFTFEDARMHNEMGGEQAAMPHAWNSQKEVAEAYQNAEEILSECEDLESEKAAQVRVLE